MSAPIQASIAYADASADLLKTPRDTEYDAFVRVTRDLRAALAKGRAGFADQARALAENRRLWTTLAIDLANRENRLPQAMRRQLLALAQFVLSHTDQVLAGSAEAAVLLEINTAMMRGLRGEGAE